MTSLSLMAGRTVVAPLFFSFVCDCKGQKQSLTDMSLAYQRELEALVNSGRYDTDDDFTVVLQPFFQKTIPPRMHVSHRGSYMSFHVFFKRVWE